MIAEWGHCSELGEDSASISLRRHDGAIVGLLGRSPRALTGV